MTTTMYPLHKTPVTHSNNTNTEQPFFAGSFKAFVHTHPAIASFFIDTNNRIHNKINRQPHNSPVSDKSASFNIVDPDRDSDKHDILYIPPYLVLDQPISLSILFPQYQNGHTLTVIIDQHASVSILDRSETHLANINTDTTRTIQYWVYEHAHVNLLYLECVAHIKYDSACQAHTQTAITCYADMYSTITIQSLISGRPSSTTSMHLYMHGMHAQARLSGALILKHTHNYCISIYQKHLAPHTTSHAVIRGVIKDNAQLSYQGLIAIDPEAINSHATQENKNILLNPGARAQSIPSLEILTNNVQCSHGSAVSYLDPEQLFYAQSRGLDTHTSRRMLTESFVRELFEENAHVPLSSLLLDNLQILLS